MKLIYRLIFIPVAAVFVIFAVANRQSLTLNLWPLPLEIDLPVYIAVLGALAAGMAIGGSAQWISDGKWRRRARASRRRTGALERRLSLVDAAREAQEMQDETAREAEPPPPAPPPPPSRGRLPRFRLKSGGGAR